MELQELRKRLDEALAQQVEERVTAARPGIVDAIRGELLRDLDARVAARIDVLRGELERTARAEFAGVLVNGALGALQVAPAPFTPATAQAVLTQLTPAQIRGIKQVRGSWRCLHCSEKYTTQRAASLHARSCEFRHRGLVQGGDKASSKWSKRKNGSGKPTPASSRGG